MPEPRHRQRIVIVGAGFAGFHAARTLSRLARRLGRQQAAGIEIVLINPTDYFLYLPLLPEVAGGVLDPRRVAVPLPDTCPGARLLAGTAEQIDLRGRQVSVAGPEGDRSIVPYDRLLLTAGSVSKLLPVPGIAQHSHGFRSIAEALYLRDHLLRQLELAASGDHAEREARCTFVVVGAGYTGTEVAAHGQLLTRAAARRHSGLRGQRLRWLLLDQAPHVLPELDRLALGRRAPYPDQARRGDPDRHHGHRGNQRRRAAVQWPVRAHPLAHLVRRRPPRPAGRTARAAHHQWPAERR